MVWDIQIPWSKGHFGMSYDHMTMWNSKSVNSINLQLFKNILHTKMSTTMMRSLIHTKPNYFCCHVLTLHTTLTFLFGGHLPTSNMCLPPNHHLEHQMPWIIFMFFFNMKLVAWEIFEVSGIRFFFPMFLWGPQWSPSKMVKRRIPGKKKTTNWPLNDVDIEGCFQK